MADGSALSLTSGAEWCRMVPMEAEPQGWDSAAPLFFATRLILRYIRDMTRKTKGARKGDVGLQVQARRPGAFRGASADGREALLDLARGAGAYVASWSGDLRWARLVEAVWPQLCVARRFGLTDKEMAPVISEAVQAVRPDIRLAAAGRVRVENRSLELSRSTLRDAMARFEARTPYPWRQYAVATIARRRGDDIADVDPVIAAEMSVAAMRSQAGLNAEGRPASTQVVVVESAPRKGKRADVIASGSSPSTVPRRAGQNAVVDDDAAGGPEGQGRFDVNEGAWAVDFAGQSEGVAAVEFGDGDPFDEMDRAQAEVERAAQAVRAAAAARAPTTPVSETKLEEPSLDGPAPEIDLADLA